MAEEITTPGQIHKDHLEGVASQVNQFGQVVTAKDITPTTSESPVEPSEDLLAMGAHVVGTEIPHAASDLLNDLGGGNTNVRVTDPSSYFSKLMGRVRKKHPNQDIIMTRKK